MAGSATQKFTGSKRTVSEGSAGKSKGSSPSTKQRYPYFAVCINDRGFQGSLFVGKIYQVLRPLPDDPAHDLRILDEEREDYLYSANRFVPIEVPGKVKRVLIGLV